MQIITCLPNIEKGFRNSIRTPCLHRCFRSAQRWCVKQHIVEVHEKLRLYVCPHCEHRAGSRGNLNVHVRAVHLKDRKIVERRARYSATFAGEIFRLSILIRKTWDERLAQSGPIRISALLYNPSRLIYLPSYLISSQRQEEIVVAAPRGATAAASARLRLQFLRIRDIRRVGPLQAHHG